MKLTGENQSTRGKICASAILSTTNPTQTDQGSNPGLRGVRLAHLLTQTPLKFLGRTRAEHVACIGAARNSHKTSIGNPEGSRPILRPTRSCDYIKIALTETACDDVDWIQLARKRDQWQ